MQPHKQQRIGLLATRSHQAMKLKGIFVIREPFISAVSLSLQPSAALLTRVIITALRGYLSEYVPCFLCIIRSATAFGLMMLKYMTVFVYSKAFTNMILQK